MKLPVCVLACSKKSAVQLVQRSRADFYLLQFIDHGSGLGTGTDVEQPEPLLTNRASLIEPCSGVGPGTPSAAFCSHSKEWMAPLAVVGFTLTSTPSWDLKLCMSSPS